MSAEALTPSGKIAPVVMRRLQENLARALVDEDGIYADPVCASAPDIWFPAVGESTSYPKLLCSMCRGRVECLILATVSGETTGVWGGVAGPGKGALTERLDRLASQGLIP